MTAKKDLKRRVRERQAKTGERYSTALQHVLERAPERGPEPAPQPRRRAFEVVELVDRTEDAALAGFHGTAMFSERIDAAFPTPVLRGRVFAAVKRMVLVLERSEPSARELVDIHLRGHNVPFLLASVVTEIDFAPRFFEQADAGVRGVSKRGRLIAFDVQTERGAIAVSALSLPAPPVVPKQPPSLWFSLLEERGVFDLEL